MTLHERLEEVFRAVFHDENMILSDETTAQDVAGWDSVAHINLMFGIEQAFGVQFTGNELAGFRNVCELKQFIAGKTAA